VNTLRLNCVPVNSGSSIASMSVSLVFVAFSSSSIAMISSSICSSNICGLKLPASHITVASMHVWQSIFSLLPVADDRLHCSTLMIYAQGYAGCVQNQSIQAVSNHMTRISIAYITSTQNDQLTGYAPCS
jgi:hypothetical protein